MKKIVLMLLVLMCGCQINHSTVEVQVEPLQEDITVEPVKNKSNFSLLAVGDNLIHGAVYKAAYQHNDGKYDFKSMFKHVKSKVQSVDLAYVNFETLAAGEKFGYSNYPNFNGPSELIDDIVDTGFDWLSISSNHSLDRGVEGLEAQYNYIHDKFDVITTGVHMSEEDASNYVVKQINGINVGMLGYTYGMNGHQLPDDKKYMIDVLDEDKLYDDIQKLSEISDIQLVSVHWGDEYQYQPNEYQKHLAQVASDAGADVIIGTHPHVIQPLEILYQADGSETVVMYSLGNFISAQDQSERMLEAMLELKISYDFDTHKHHFDVVQVSPLINQIENGWTFFEVLPWDMYNQDAVNRHTLSNLGFDMSKTRFINLWNEVYPDFKIE